MSKRLALLYALLAVAILMVSVGLILLLLPSC